ncbi:phosphatidylserine decarboxylase Psd2 [Schizosaccharomyces japonicus yFS275]|uniref:Phosphatidylserine decarboxylase proenzyme 1, mitochondrial n=1 Tax=Schizosaccharomyces japonicus (strain yFS275 / FY16936) TaxID=402676 RepID=B6K301_SCHJY|nr:phosphatidylserine decarboxylase Psd2 [Schizosaccharomyces japonicus yFS275]EEB07858.1 phosphatidylserine decarboxylase Psd2 [Schizosaccharomyces japonicus yFS275]
MRQKRDFHRFHRPHWRKLNLHSLVVVKVGVVTNLKLLHNRIHRIRQNRGRFPHWKRLSINVKPQGSWQAYLLSSLPLRSLSRIWGHFNNKEWPTFLRKPGFTLYAWLFGCNLTELKDPDLTHYRNFQDFFYRELRPEARPVDEDSFIVSPVDGRIVCQGRINNNRIQHVKGLSYSLEALLGGLSSCSPQVVDFDDSCMYPEKVAEHMKFATKHEIPNYRQTPRRVTVPSRRDGIERNRSAPALMCALTSSRLRLCPDCNRASMEEQEESDLAAGVKCSHISPAKNDAGDDDACSDSSSFYSLPASDNVPIPASVDEKKTSWIDTAEIASLDSLPWRNIRPGHQLFYSVIYLAPGDYHRFHSPADWVVESRRHFSGELFSVSPYLARRLHNLFVLNERVALIGRYKHGFMSMIPVGATNVGSIVINCDPTLSTNRMVLRKKSLGSFEEAVYSKASPVLHGQPFERGEQVGGFKLGSTVVLVFEAPEDYEFTTYQGQYVRVGESL